MQDLIETLHSLDGVLADTVGDALAGGAVTALCDAEVLECLAIAASISRRAEALLVESVADAQRRCDLVAHADRMTTAYGCRSVSELVQRATRVSGRTATDLIKVGRAIVRDVAPTSGDRLPADFPQMREALADGVVGVDGLLAVIVPLAHTAGAAGRAAHLAADEELAAAARGEGVDGAPPACADDLRAQASVWAMYLDQDGAEPREAKAMRKRGVTLGVCRDGVVPIRGGLLPEVAAQLERIFDSVLNPKVEGAPAPRGPVFADSVDDGDRDEPIESVADDRTRAQKQHDALATALTILAGSGGLPTIGGAAPTLVVSVLASDLEAGRGFAHLTECDEPLSLSAARHIACTGGVQRATVDENGRVISLLTFDRVFTHHQRKAIGLRDGGCVIPGCRIRANWCEVHHVEEHSRGGPTHIDNGVLLCWFHHRTLDTSGWKVRMNHGVPEVRGPHWWDSTMRWRPVTKSPVRMRERVARRT
ncbi:HNH endonuclease signature motif containing protein [Microbacterium sp. C7(2022)]|uniref:HNH endonuclease signature motif containing protein n=1 Tax=Microbacterium sp. C7(2022) TaxID=2992759 RepID=UPI00237C1C33|nr:HNH endonuclease signature motif containing protein [Microbacterium sp. C7(2022)]MDE0546596.1 HNH endonuclease [Microbacterium sp. C7(2022)]